MYGATYFKWAHYFLFMVTGAYIGANKISLKTRPVYDWVGFIVSFVLYYTLMFACTKSSVISQWQILSLIPLMGITIYLYKLCSSPKCNVFLDKNKRWICAISGLCLESYIVQYALFTDKMNNIFPLNIIITMIFNKFSTIWIMKINNITNYRNIFKYFINNFIKIFLRII